MKAAAIQMEAGLADVDGNIERAEVLARRAVDLGAELVVLPEFFTTAMAFDERMLDTARPLEGAPAQMLLSFAARHAVTIGGSFLARHADGKVRNTFVLAHPSGVLGHHDKDIPTMWENCYYVGGHDDGVIETPFGPAGIALCWEMVRSQTARRLRGRVRMIIGGSCWWDTPDDLPPSSLWRIARAQNHKLCERASPTLARLVGVPLIHANWCGRVDGRWALGSRYVSRYVQHAVIVDASGRELARRDSGDGPGVIVADVDLREPAPVGDIPPSFWIHRINRLPQWRFFWWVQNAHGRRYRERAGNRRSAAGVAMSGP